MRDPAVSQVVPKRQQTGVSEDVERVTQVKPSHLGQLRSLLSSLLLVGCAVSLADKEVPVVV